MTEISAEETLGANLMTLYPAIDIRGGQAVRLLRGDYDRETPYDADPLNAARRWHRGGAEVLHVVDLDGARAGRPQNLELIGRIAAAVPIPVQTGGGLRDAAAVAAVLESGAARAVLGTRAQREPAFVGELVAEHGAERIVAAVDARAGRVAVEGWEQATDTPVPELVTELTALGARRFIYTPVEVDGTLAGPGLDGLADVAAACEAAGAELIYSGGVGSLHDLRSLAALPLPSIGGVIVGRALYEQRFSVAEAIAALGGADGGFG
ncbi:MAG: 1-(5-phosphoribosyl)-5-[(5-phosphoribosylamino)methylideneamino]imidazole-4-carboxamide isomerase [Solirubrobacterales bacterium]